MKRLVWLLLAVFCTAIAQVQPVELANAKPMDCPCCQAGHPCSMPGCCPPPVSGGRSVNAAPRALASASAARRQGRPVRQVEATFYTSFVKAVTVSVALSALSRETSVASVPLYKVHGSFLI